MITTRNDNEKKMKKFSALPALIIVGMQWFFRFVLPILIPEDMVIQIGVLSGLAGGIALYIWWSFFSGASGPDRLGGLFLMVSTIVITFFLVHISIRTAMMGMMFAVYAVPVQNLLFVTGLVVCRNLGLYKRRIIMTAVIILSTVFWVLLRTDGMTGDAKNKITFRWAPTEEDRLLEEIKTGKGFSQNENADIAETAEWPGFRGPQRDSVVRDVRISTDWSIKPPKELWRRPVGPGCSSFAISGSSCFTQEQRGDNEAVTCYDLMTGKQVWIHKNRTRFYDSHAGAGPRSTPTVAEKRVYTLGATGILNVLDAVDGSLIWSRNAADDFGLEPLPWGFTGSPYVCGDTVIISLSGKLAAYNTADGNPLWSGPDGGNSYSSPQPVTIDGTQQIILMSKSGALSVQPDDGKVLWNYAWKVEDRILQPALIEGGDLLLAGEIQAVRRIKVSHSGTAWNTADMWSSNRMILNFNDIVIHKGYVYGFDGAALVCVDLADGNRKWKGERYRGFTLLLPDQDLLLVLSEQGDLALVEASPVKFRELGRIKALEGKTWNHPAMAGDILLLRNAREMAAYRL